MAGILDSKSRVFDAIVTLEGRRQMAAGTFSVSYATFTDSGVAYEKDSVDGHVDPTGRIYFEACSLPQDVITLEANDEGALSLPTTFNVSGSFLSSSLGLATVKNGRITVQNVHHGRMIATYALSENSSDAGKGFFFTDTSGVTGSVTVLPNVLAGVVAGSGPPWKATIGTKGGINATNFAKAISTAINELRNAGGPDVQSSYSRNVVYLDTDVEYLGTKIEAIGKLSSPIKINNASVGGNAVAEELEDAKFASQITGILTSSFDNFVEQQTIGTIDRLFEDHEFILSQESVDFDLTKIEKSLYNSFGGTPPSVNSLDALFSDDKLSHLENFMYLPPIVKTSDDVLPDKTKISDLAPFLLGSYPSWGNNEKKLTREELQRQLKPFEGTRAEILFSKTSRANNVMCQIFEVTDSSVSKMDVVDFGLMESASPGTPPVHVFFVGKVYLDGRGTSKFVNIFTIVLSESDGVGGGIFT